MGSFPVTKTNPNALCCAAFYEQDWVRAVLGESFHPGGIELSARLIRGLHLPAKSRVLDLACGIGTTTRLMAREFGLDAIGLDISEANSAKARESFPSDSRFSATFVTATAEAMPFPDESFDAVVCECAISTFTDQPRVLAEIVRVLKPGGVVGISDMIVEGELPADITGLVAPWACLIGAHSTIGCQSLFLSAGLRVIEYADESASLREFVVELKRKLLTAGLGRIIGAIPGLDCLDVRGLRDLLQRASELVRKGIVQYGRLTFAKGRPRFNPPAHVEQKVMVPVGSFCEPSTGCCQAE
jgi:SAM-dependent methyltransferase